MDDPEPSRRPAEPTPRIRTGDLVRHLRSEEESRDPDSVKADNDRNAADELAKITELSKNGAFQWFFEQFIKKPFQKASTDLRSQYTKPEELPAIHREYLALRGIAVGLLEREIAHRTRLDPKDTELPALREKLALL